MSDQTSRVAVVDVGTPPSGYQNGEEVTSPEFMSLGRRWTLGICPGGEKISDDGWVALFLSNALDDRTEVDFLLIARDSADRKVTVTDFARHEFAPADVIGDGYGNANFAKRSIL